MSLVKVFGAPRSSPATRTGPGFLGKILKIRIRIRIWETLGAVPELVAAPDLDEVDDLGGGHVAVMVGVCVSYNS